MEPSYPEYADLRAAAVASARTDGGFVDPGKLARLSRLGRSRDWQIAVLGHAGRPDLTEMHLLLIADERGIDPPLPAWLVEQRQAEAVRREAEQARHDAHQRALWDEWNAVVATLPVPVRCAYNYSGPNHLETWTQGAVHILVAGALKVGRLDRRPREALCTTDSSRRHQVFAWPDGGDGSRIPTCKRCIRIAGRLTGQPVAALLAA